MPHLHDLAVISQGVDDDTGKLAKKSGDAPSNELLHNVHCYLEGDKKMVELHVDLLTVKERMRLYPWWGGGISKRVDLTKNLVEEYGQDEAAFHQNDERKNHWHQEGKVRLTQSEKQRGAVSHCAVVTNYRHGVGGNLVSDETWAAYELVRPEYDPAFKNPFMVWARVGGDYGYWGGAEVAMQFKEVQQFLRWEEEQPQFKEQLAALGYAGPQRMQACFGADRSQTHLLGKPDGIVMSKFNKGTTHKSKTNVKSADKFVIPRDVVLLPGDINTNPIPIPVPPTTPVSLSGSNSEVCGIEVSDDGLEDHDLEFDKIPEPPLGQSAISEEVARIFDDEVICGAITEFEDDDEDGLYKVTFYDGDEEQLDVDEYMHAWKHAHALANPTKRPKKKRPRNTKAAAEPTSLNPPTDPGSDSDDDEPIALTILRARAKDADDDEPIAAAILRERAEEVQTETPTPTVRLEYKVGDTYSFGLTDDSFKGLEQVAKELGWYQPGMRKGAKSKKRKVNKGDIFFHNETKAVCRVVNATKDHKAFGDLKGTITARPFNYRRGETPQYSLEQHARNDFDIMEMDYTYVRPSSIVIVQGALSRADGLRVSINVPAYERSVAGLVDKQKLYHDTAAYDSNISLTAVLDLLPMFVNEKSWIEQVVADFDNILEVSPIVHCEIAGRGIEYANGRAKWDFRNGCTGKLSELEPLCRRAYGKYNIPQELAAKYERRVRDYMRSYRMGALSADLEKMRAVIKTHRNMLDSYEAFIKSDGVDDETDTHAQHCSREQGAG